MKMPLRHPSLNPPQNTVLTTPWKGTGVIQSQSHNNHAHAHARWWVRVKVGFDLVFAVFPFLVCQAPQVLADQNEKLFEWRFFAASFFVPANTEERRVPRSGTLAGVAFSCPLLFCC
jgi:hypothetical protein